MNESLREHLLATIAHLSTKRSHLLVQLQEIEEVLKSLRREEESLPSTPRIVFPEPPRDGEYAKISVRWAVFLFLAEHANGPHPLGRIADALREGGSASKAQSFNSNVSAVMSQMVTKNELLKTEEGFSLTDHGKAVWHGIKNSEKFVNRNDQNVQSQPELLGYEAR
jgi:hypothetical protein